MKQKRKLTIKTKEELFEQEIIVAHIFTNKYSRKLVKNEFHCPLAAKIVVENEDKINLFILAKPIIQVDEKGDINIITNATMDQIRQVKPYFTKEELKKTINLFKLYKYKSSLGLVVEEALEMGKINMIMELEKVIKIKIPFEIGGGF